MVRDELTLRHVTNVVAIALAAGGIGLLGMALIAEIARRCNSGSRIVVVADRILPAPARRWAVALLAMLSTVGIFIGPQVASADTSVRQWLNDPAPTTDVPVPHVSTDESAPHHNEDPGAVHPTVASASDSTARSPVTTPSPTVGPPTEASPSDPHPARVVHAAPSAASPSLASSIPARPGGASARTPSGRSAKPGAAPSVAAPLTRAPNPDPRYVVAAGDCLWSIAARLLGPGATSRAIDRGWRQIYDANRASIGENPSLIHPGLALTIPRFDNTP